MRAYHLGGCRNKNFGMKVGNVGNVKTQLCRKDGCSFYTYSLQILDQVIRLISQLPAVLVLQSLVLVKFPVVLQLSTWSSTLPTLDCQQRWQNICYKYSYSLNFDKFR